jgi:hypothetical protein
MTAFDETYTDTEFRREMQQADSSWMAHAAREEPDLEVEGLARTFWSRLLGLFGRS